VIVLVLLVACMHYACLRNYCGEIGWACRMGSYSNGTTNGWEDAERGRGSTALGWYQGAVSARIRGRGLGCG